MIQFFGHCPLNAASARDGHNSACFMRSHPSHPARRGGRLLSGTFSSSLPSQPPAGLDCCLGWSFLLRLVPWKTDGAWAHSPTWTRGPGYGRGRLFCGSPLLLSGFDSGASPRTASTEPVGTRACLQSPHRRQGGCGPCWGGTGEGLESLWNPSFCLG